MARNWDRISRKGLDIALAATSLGFHAAKFSTRLGFSVARGIVTAAAGVTSGAVDTAVFGGLPAARPVFTGAVSSALTLAEQITLAPIHIGEYITNTSFIAAHGSINVLSVIFPGSSEASFSLTSFISLVRREWKQSYHNGEAIANQYGVTQIARAIVAWAALQGVTQEWQERRWFKYLKELDVKDAPKHSEPRTPRTSRVRVTSDTIIPGKGGSQIITADMGSEPSKAERLRLRRSRSKLLLRQSSFSSLASFSTSISIIDDLPEDTVPISELKTTLRRFSKMVLAGYGGASLLFFGVHPRGKPAAGSSLTRIENPSIGQAKTREEAALTDAIDASEAEAAGEAAGGPESDSAQPYSWWDIVVGKHDQEILEDSLGHHEQQTTRDRLKNLKGQLKATAVIGDEHLLPRFWVITDYSREQVVLVLRGTMSLNEIAADLTCEPEWFQPAETSSPAEQEEADVYHGMPGSLRFPSMASPRPRSQGQGHSKRRAASVDSTPRYHVHGGMLRMARLMGGIGKPVQLAVQKALHSNPDFELVLCGHSLGAGVAALLGMTWADPKTCLTVPASGLPVGRRVQVYCFAPPALTDAALSRLARTLITSFVYSNDVVARLSLGTIRDIRNAAFLLCEANEPGGEKQEGEGYTSVTNRAKEYKAGKSKTPGEMEWFIAMRKTLEANMQHCDMFPPGRVLWAMRDDDIHPSYQLHGEHNDKLRLFDVLDVEKVFSQIVFAKNMLTAHMPHQYDQALHELL